MLDGTQYVWRQLASYVWGQYFLDDGLEDPQDGGAEDDGGFSQAQVVHRSDAKQLGLFSERVVVERSRVEVESPTHHSLSCARTAEARSSYRIRSRHNGRMHPQSRLLVVIVEAEVQLIACYHLGFMGKQLVVFGDLGSAGRVVLGDVTGQCVQTGADRFQVPPDDRIQTV